MQNIFVLETNMLVSKYRNIYFTFVLCFSCVGVVFVGVISYKTLCFGVACWVHSQCNV